MSTTKSADIPEYELYREDSAGSGQFQIHLEPLHTRSRRHRWEINLHRHRTSFQIVALAEGRGEVFLDGSYHRFEAPAVIFLPPATVHGFRFSSHSTGQVLTALAEFLDAVAAQDRYIAGFFSAPKILPQASRPEAWKKLCGKFAEIDSELREREPGNMTCASSHLAVALVQLFRQLPSADAATETSADRDAARMSALKALISRHYGEHRPVGFYAGQFGLTAHHLNRIARQHTGKTVRQMVEERVMGEARKALKTTGRKVIDIAESLGYSDPAYFNRSFRRHSGMTPVQFRRNAAAR